jgi:hypothetical protein
MAVLVPCLVALRSEFNLVAAGRDKRSDGWLGDRAHALTPSDHNPDESGRTPYSDADNVDEVHGLDVDDTGPWPPGFDFDSSVERIRLRHALGVDARLQNIIRNGRIASRSWGWSWRTFTGSNGHYEHAHFSARYLTKHENDTSPWGVYVIIDKAGAKLIIDELMARPVGKYGSFGGTVQTRMARTDNIANDQLPALRAEVKTLTEQVATVSSALTELLDLVRGTTAGRQT